MSEEHGHDEGMAFVPLNRDELVKLANSASAVNRRAAGEILLARLRAKHPIQRPWIDIMGMLGVAALVIVLAWGVLHLRPVPPASRPSKATCDHVDSKLRMAKGLLQRGRQRDLEDASLLVAAVAPAAGECRADARLSMVLNVAARAARDQALATVDMVLRSPQLGGAE